jgi:hypothetical protein
VQHDRERGHAERDHGEREENLDRCLAALEPALPGIEIARRPGSEGFMRFVFPERLGTLIFPPDQPQQGRKHDGDDEEAAHHDKQVIGLGVGGEAPHGDNEPQREADHGQVNDGMETTGDRPMTADNFSAHGALLGKPGDRMSPHHICHE